MTDNAIWDPFHFLIAVENDTIFFFACFFPFTGHGETCSTATIDLQWKRCVTFSCLCFFFVAVASVAGATGLKGT